MKILEIAYGVDRRLDELKNRLLKYYMFNPCFGSLQRVTDEWDKYKTLTLDAENMDLLKDHDDISRQYALKCNLVIIKWVSEEMRIAYVGTNNL